MFDTEMMCQVEKVSVRVKVDGPNVRRRMRFTLGREFDALIAAALNDGQEIRQGIIAHSLKKATMPIDALSLRCRMVGADGTTVHLGEATGVHADAKAGKEEEGGDSSVPPAISLVIEAPYSNEAWAFLGRNCAAFCRVTISKRQLELNLSGDAKKTREAKRAARRAKADAEHAGLTVEYSDDGKAEDMRPIDPPDDAGEYALADSTEEPTEPARPGPRLSAVPSHDAPPKRSVRKLRVGMDEVELNGNRFTVEVTQEGDDYIATAIDTPGPLHGRGVDIDQAVDNLRKAISIAMAEPATA